MNNTLCVLLPVYNTHDTLESDVSDILELLPEVADRFELCILDDGSTDETTEVAGDLAARYPQISLIRHPIRLGLAEAIQTGFDHTQCEIIWLGDEAYGLDPHDLRVLWQLRDTERKMSGQADFATGCELWLDRLSAWKPAGARSPRHGGLQMIRRQSFEHFRLEQALAMVARVDSGNRRHKSASAWRPNFMSKSKRLAWDE